MTLNPFLAMLQYAADALERQPTDVLVDCRVRDEMQHLRRLIKLKLAEADRDQTHI